MMMTQSEFAVPAGPRGVAASRHFTRQCLHDWRLDHLVDSAMLLVSEAVTNVLLHAGSKASLLLDSSASRLRVEVRDSSSKLPVLRGRGARATNGRGLVLIDSLSSGWGAEPDGEGKVVWFELPIAKHEYLNSRPQHSAGGDSVLR